MLKRVFVLIVVYNKKLFESKTIKALLDISVENLNIVIVNNGPEVLAEDDIFIKLQQKYISVTLKNFITNKPLSWVYNDFINEYNADRYIILDDDTVLTLEYFEKMVFSNEDYMIGLPRMISSYNNKQYTPFFNGKIRNEAHGYISGDSNFSITSAIVLSKEVTNIIKSRFITVFDENFALYCIDTALFIRIETIVKEGIAAVNYLSNVSLIHEFSNHLIKDPKWRTGEKLIGNILIIKHYSNNSFTQVIKQVLLKLLKFKFADSGIILKTYFKGKHVRCFMPRYINE